MRKPVRLITLSLVLGFAVSACGVKGKPLPPLKKGEVNDQTQGKKNPLSR